MEWEKDYVNKVICGDCLEVMKGIPDKSVDLVITDPPYGVNYEGGHFHSGDVNIKRKREKLANDTNNIYPELFKEMFRLLKDNSGGGVCFLCGLFIRICLSAKTIFKISDVDMGKK